MADEPSPRPGTARAHAYVLVGLAVCWLPALIDSGAVGRVAALQHLAFGADPYFVPEHALLLYVWAPLVVLSACILLLSPGLLLAAAFDAARSIPQWLLSGLLLSLVVVSAAAASVAGAMGTPLTGSAFSLTVMGCAGAAAVLLQARARTRPLSQPFGQPGSVSTLVLAFTLAAGLMIALVPKFYWENFNGDGYQGYEGARLLVRQSLPFFPPGSGALNSFPSVKAALYPYPVSWFVRLFEAPEAASRLPYCLSVIGLYAGLIGLIEHARPAPLRTVDRLVVALGLALFSLVMAFSATTDVPHSDIALPGVEDTLFMALFCGFALSFLKRSTGWTLAFLVAAFMTSPHGTPTMGAWLLAALVFLEPPYRRLVGVCLAALVLMSVFDIAAPGLFTAAGLPAPGQEHDTSGLLRRVTNIQIRQWERFGWAFVPAGILPAIALAAWFWQDRVARTFTAAVALLFGFYYVQDRLVLHYLVPVMVMPWVVFWRLKPAGEQKARPLLVGGALASLAMAFAVSWPSTWRPSLTNQIVGGAVDDRTGAYARGDMGYFKRQAVLQSLFPSDTDPRVPKQTYGGHAILWNFYGLRAPPTTPRNYVVQWASAPPPAPRAQPFAQQDGVTVYVLDPAVRARHAAIRMPEVTGSRFYLIPKGTLFAHAGE